jgi:hypothetical protein
MNFRNPMVVLSYNEIIFSQDNNVGSVVIRLIDLH